MFKNILVVLKQTPYEQFNRLRQMNMAPAYVKWDRLRSRHETHTNCVDNVVKILNKFPSIQYKIIKREELHREVVNQHDLILTIGGDGTLLNASTYISNNYIPVLGINSDPKKENDKKEYKKTENGVERNSIGSLCALNANTIDVKLTELLSQSNSNNETENLFSERVRLRCRVRDSLTEKFLPPSLNDVLISHPVPASVSRFSFSILDKDGNKRFSSNIWSSGLWVSTATGSTAAVYAAGGTPMDSKSNSLQYIIRENLVDRNNMDVPVDPRSTNDYIHNQEELFIKWSSYAGAIYVDGSHFKCDLEMGDEVYIDNKAPTLKLLDPHSDFFKF